MHNKNLSLNSAQTHTYRNALTLAFHHWIWCLSELPACNWKKNSLFRTNMNFSGFIEKLNSLTNHSLLSFWSQVERNLLFHKLIPSLYPLACISFKGRAPFEVSLCSLALWGCSHYCGGGFTDDEPGFESPCKSGVRSGSHLGALPRRPLNQFYL